MPVMKEKKSASSTVKKQNVSATATNRQPGHSFFEDVWAVVRLIPKGRVTSYGAIAGYLGTRMSARMVGWAMNAAHTANPGVPAQRVVNRNGMLSGKHHFPTEEAMEKMLLQDGVAVENDTVKDFEKLFWDPAKEILL